MIVAGFLVELRRGPGPWSAPVLVAVGLYAAVTQLDDGAVWSYVTAAVTTSALLIGPLAAGVACWSGSRSARRGVADGERLAARGALAAPAAAMAALLSWTMLAYGTVAAVLFVWCATRATWGGPSWLWLGSATLGIAASTCVGYAAGRAMPWRFTPLAVAIGIFVVDAYFESHSDLWAAVLAPAADRILLPFDEVRRGLLGGQVLWYAGLIAAAFGVVALVVRANQRETVAILAAAVVLLGLGASVVHMQGSAFAAFIPLRWVCRGSAPQVCVHPAFAHALDEVAAGADSVAGRLAATPFPIERVEQHPRGPRWAPTPGAVSYGLDSARPGALRQAMLEIAAGAMNYPTSCLSLPPQQEQQPGSGRDLMLIVVTWAAGYPEAPLPGFTQVRSAYDWFTALPADNRSTWMTAHASAIRNCTLTAADFR